MFGVLALLSRVLVFRLVTADAALGCGGPRKANDPRDLVALRLPYPLDMRKSQKILTLSSTDELTGLLNRRGFLTMATQ